MSPLIRRPVLKRPLDVFLIVFCTAMTLYVLGEEVLGPGKTKDYPLWYAVGEAVRDGAPLYDTPAYLYPPFPALFFAPLTIAGKAPFYLSLLLTNALALWLADSLSQRLAAGQQRPGPWIEMLPVIIVLPHVYDMFDLGQPNLVLLVLMLLGFLALRGKHPLLSGGLFAAAAAIKVFPVSVLPYLLWRRHWRASASFATFLAVFLVLAPAPIRGFDRNIGELTQWFEAMKGTEDGFGQREAQNWSWKNQSVVAITHRILRPVNYRAVDPDSAPATMNLLDVSYRTANLAVLGVMAALGLGFVALMLPAGRLTRTAFAEETGILICLMTITSPLARTYYFVWLLYPLTVLVQRAVDDERPEVRRRTWGAIALAFVLSMLAFVDVAQAFGTNTLAALVIAGGLGWHMRNPPVRAATS